jgi:SPP1 gp7 family putative phage head morphogenesis protein
MTLRQLRYPLLVEGLYARKLLKVVSVLESQLNRRLKPELERLLEERADSDEDFSEKINEILGDIDEVSKRIIFFAIKSLKIISTSLRKNTQKEIRRSLRSVVSTLKMPKALPVDILNGKYIITELNPLILSWINANIRLIKSLSSKVLDDLAVVIYEGYMAGSSYKDIAEEIHKKFQIAENRAKLIAKDQIAKLNSCLLRKQYLDLDLPIYQWKTCNDERVRKSHRILQNKYCTWLDPTIFATNKAKWLKKSTIGAIDKHPGEDYQCRCSLVPVFPKFLVGSN